jgi:hypothetical protein
MDQLGIRLVDLGFGGDFRASTDLSESIVRNLVVDGTIPFDDVEIIRTRETRAVAAVLGAQALITHIVAHGVSAEGASSFESDDGTTLLKLPELATILEHGQNWIQSRVLIADCCDSFSPAFRRDFSRCIDHELIYIGGQGDITWRDALLFMPMLYTTLFDLAERSDTVIVNRIEKARDAFKLVAGRACPYRVTKLEGT